MDDKSNLTPEQAANLRDRLDQMTTVAARSENMREGDWQWAVAEWKALDARAREGGAA